MKLAKRGQKLTEFHHAVLTGTWVGPRGVSYETTWAQCRDLGWINSDGELTKYGKKALDEYAEV